MAVAEYRDTLNGIEKYKRIQTALENAEIAKWFDHLTLIID